MAVLFSTTRGVSWRRDFFCVFHTSKMSIHSSFPEQKCVPRTQTVTRSGELAACGFPRGLNSYGNAEVAYPP